MLCPNPRCIGLFEGALRTYDFTAYSVGDWLLLVPDGLPDVTPWCSCFCDSATCEFGDALPQKPRLVIKADQLAARLSSGDEWWARGAAGSIAQRLWGTGGGGGLASVMGLFNKAAASSFPIG